MDRNGEWAKKHLLSRMNGHAEGARTVRLVVEAAGNAGIKVLSLFAFSTENWLRPVEEVRFLMGLLDSFIKKEGQALIDEGVRLLVSGRNGRIPAELRESVNKIVAASAHNDKMILNVALDYGGKDEISRAAAKLAKDVAEKKITLDEINEDLFGRYLDHDLPPVDLLIRTGGEQRISNFMLWQCAYAEFYFTPVFWPDFSAEELNRALLDYASRKRRFGKTDEQT